jgi:hypothetical protein
MDATATKQISRRKSKVRVAEKGRKRRGLLNRVCVRVERDKSSQEEEIDAAT